MKGVVFNAAEEAVVELFDADTWDDLLDAAGVDGVYNSVGDYPDAELVAIVTAASEATGLPIEDVLTAVGRKALGHLAGRVPSLVEHCQHPFEFLRLIHDVIHVEVMKLYPDSKPPGFTYEDLPGNGLRMIYTSPRCLDALAEGLIMGVGDRFDTELEVTRTETGERGKVQIDVMVVGAVAQPTA